jgi:hypothetical protein
MCNPLQPDPECKEASKQIEAICSDPMTKHYGCAGEAIELFMRRHIKECKKCKQTKDAF